MFLQREDVLFRGHAHLSFEALAESLHVSETALCSHLLHVLCSATEEGDGFVNSVAADEVDERETRETVNLFVERSGSWPSVRQ